MEIFIIILLIFLNGIFSMSEIAIISARKTSLNKEAKEGNKAAKSALKLSEHPNNFFSTLQVGITLIGILTGLYSGDVLSSKFYAVLESWGLVYKYTYSITQITIVILVTYLTIVFGELVPKRIGLGSPEKVAKIIVQPMIFLSHVAAPFVWILSKSTNLIFKIFGIEEKESKVTEEEIKSMIREGTKDGEVQQVEQDIVERVFTLGDRALESIMTHRMDIVWLEVEMSKKEIRKIIANNPYSKYPVRKEDSENIEGIVYVKDLFNQIDSPNFNISKILRPAQYFYENMEVYSALEKMKTNHNNYGLIIDEFGSISGVVTLKDIMEAIVGEIPEANEDPEIIKRKDGTYLVDGQCSFYNFLHYFNLGDLYPKNEYNTVGGVILEELDHLPHAGETVKWEKFSFEIMDMDGTRIDKILVHL
jgi:putative hemolysin